MEKIPFTVETIQKVYKMLADETSKEIYTNLLAYKITNSRTYLNQVVNTYVRECPWFDGCYKDGFDKLVEVLSEKRGIVLFGAGKDGAKLASRLQNDPRFIGFCSSIKEQQKNGYCGYPVMSPEELFARKDLSVVISTGDYRDEIMDILTDNGYPQELIIDGPHFYRPISGEMEQYFGPDFLKFQDEEIFVDAGCFNFKSSVSLGKRCKKIKVYAFEPDPSNYQQCLANAGKMDKKHLIGVKFFQNGVWNEETTLSFCAKGNSSSCLCEGSTGNLSVSVLPIDSVIDPEDQITMVKMDIEGAELEALQGAKRTIQRDKPKLAICIYHKPEDLWEIPLYIQQLVPEYCFHIRHYSFGETETVLYAVMPQY